MNDEEPSQDKTVDWQSSESFRSMSREQLSVVMDRIAEGITVQDREGRLVYANDIAAHWLGYEDQETLLNTPATKVMEKFEILEENGAPFPLQRLPGRRTIHGEGEVSEIVRFRIKATGDERWSIVRAAPVYNALHEVEFAVNIFQDITDLKKSEQDLRFLAEISDMLANSLDYQAVLADIAKMAIQSIADWCAIHLVEGNETIVQLTVAHKDPAKLALTRELQEQYPPDPQADRGIYQVMRTGEAVFYPDIPEDAMKVMARDEKHYEMMLSLGLHSAMILPFIARGRTLGAITLVWSESPHRYGDREVMLGRELARRAALAIDNVRLFQEATHLNTELESQVARRTAQLERSVHKLQSEITERQKVEKDLERNEALFSDLFDLSPDAIFLVNHSGEIVRANAQAAAMFGYDQTELLGKFIDMLLPDRFRMNHAGHRKKYQETPQRRAMGADLDLYGRRKSGDEFPVDVMLSPLKIEEEWLVISVVRDITDQKRARIELAEVQHQLMDTIEKERLLLAQELHDGTIQELFSITFELAEIERDLSQNGHEKVVEKLRASTATTHHVIQGLRNLSTELRPPALAPFGLEQAILNHMERYQELHPDMAIHLDLSPDGPVLDERMRLILFRIYQNAVSNVARHAQAEQLWVRLDLNDRQVTLEIEDNGVGFELPARWVEMARAGHLGLVGIRERVEAIGGQLKIITKPGKGTLIRVTVPYRARQGQS